MAYSEALKRQIAAEEAAAKMEDRKVELGLHADLNETDHRIASQFSTTYGSDGALSVAVLRLFARVFELEAAVAALRAKPVAVPDAKDAALPDAEPAPFVAFAAK